MSGASSPGSSFEAGTHRLLIGLYALTGLTSVSYEVLWARMLSLQFGVSVIAVVLTVAAFMTGLGAGSLFMSSRVARITRPLRLLGFLEAGIAGYAMLLPLLLQFASSGLEDAAARVSLLGWYGMLVVAAWCLLLLPAFAMGAGFPLVLAALGKGTTPLARAYGWNTFGAACGALLPLWLLPVLGWAGASRVVAGIGLLVSLGMLWLAAKLAPGASAEHSTTDRPRWYTLAAYGGIGAASLMLEIAWTRMFGMIMLRTEYVLAVILASFLMGIGLGSLLAIRLKQRIWFIVLPVSASAYALLSLWLLPRASAWVERTDFSSLLGAMTSQGLALVLLTLPVTLALGAWLPLLHDRLKGGGMWLYGANSLGGAVGAAIAGVALIPLVGSAGTIVIAALILVAAGLVWADLRMAWLAVPVLGALAAPVAKLPPVSALLPQAQAGSRDLYLYEDAVSLTHVIEQQDGQRLLLTDLHRMDASTEPTAVFVQKNQARLPLLLHAGPHTVLFVGLGTGISLAGSAPYPGLQRRAVELSQGAIDGAARWFAPVNGGILAQTAVTRDDARHFLSATSEKFDVIIGDLFHPDLAGLSSLLSLQQFERARARLNENGLFVQWIALNQFDAESLSVILRTFRKVFPEAQMFVEGMHLALVGPRDRFEGVEAAKRNMQRLSARGQDAATAGEGIWTWMGRYCGPIPESRGAVQDEWSPVIEFSLPRASYGVNPAGPALQAVLQNRPDMQASESRLGVHDEDKEAFERAYVATDLMERSLLATVHGAQPEADRLLRLAYEANPKDHWVSYTLADAMFSSLAQARSVGLSEQDALDRILRLDPQHVESLRLLWRLERSRHDPQAAATRERLLALSPLDLEARTGE